MPPPDTEELLALVGQIYEAAFEPERWNTALPAIIAALNGERGFLGFTSTVRGHSVASVSHEFDPEFMVQWQGEFAGFDPWYEQSGNLPTGAVVQGAEVVPFDDLRAKDVHAAVFHAYGVDDLVCTSVANRDRYFDFVTVHRSRKRHGLFDETEVRTMRMLAPHLVRAGQIHDKLSFLSATHRAHEALLDLLPYGVILLDANGHLLGANREAERILASRDGLTIRAGALHASQPGAQRKFAGAISETCDTVRRGEGHGGALLSVPRSGGQHPYQVLVAPVPVRSGERVFGFASARAAAVVVVSDPDSAPEPAADTLRRLFGLTPALARLAAALAAGRTLAEYAEEASITQGTARWHLKALFARTGTSRQAELVRLLLGGVAQVRGAGPT